MSLGHVAVFGRRPTPRRRLCSGHGMPRHAQHHPTLQAAMAPKDTSMGCAEHLPKPGWVRSAPRGTQPCAHRCNAAAASGPSASSSFAPPDRAADMLPIVTDIFIQCRKVRSLAAREDVAVRGAPGLCVRRRNRTNMRMAAVAPFCAHQNTPLPLSCAGLLPARAPWCVRCVFCAAG